MLDALTYAGKPGVARRRDRLQLVKGDICDGTAGRADIVGFRHRGDRALRADEPRGPLDSSRPLAFVQTNVMGTATLLDRARKAGVKAVRSRVHRRGVRRSGPDIRFTERTPIAPRSPYSASKADRITWCGSYFETFQFPGVDYALLEQLRAVSISREAHPLMILNALSDTPLRSWQRPERARRIHVEDHLRGRRARLDAGREGEVLQHRRAVGAAEPDIVREILKILGKPESLIRYVTDRPGHDQRLRRSTTPRSSVSSAGPASASRKGWSIRALYRENEAWWARCAPANIGSWYEKNYAHRLPGGGQ